MLLLKNWNRGLLLLQQKLEGIREGQIAIDKTDYLEIIKDSFKGNQIRKTDVMMISLWQKNRNSFGETWSQSADHKKDAKWLQELQSEGNVKKQKKIDITT